MNRMVRKAYDCLAEVLNHEPSEAGISGSSPRPP